MSNEHARDEDLMKCVANGQRDAMHLLLRRHATPLLTFIHRMIGDWHRAEELFQEAFLAVWQNRVQYRYPRPFRPWLFGIAVNKCRADFRKHVAAPMLFVEEPDLPAMASDPSPVEAAIAAESAVVVSRGVAMLPPKQRAVLVLRVWNGLEYREIAQILERSEATIRCEMFHALAAMRRYLEPRLRQTEKN